MSQGYDLASYLKKFDLKINDLVEESGRPRDTLYTWFKNDRKLLSCVIRSRLASNFKAASEDLDKKLGLTIVE